MNCYNLCNLFMNYRSLLINWTRPFVTIEIIIWARLLLLVTTLYFSNFFLLILLVSLVLTLVMLLAQKLDHSCIQQSVSQSETLAAKTPDHVPLEYTSLGISRDKFADIFRTIAIELYYNLQLLLLLTMIYLLLELNFHNYGTQDQTFPCCLFFLSSYGFIY